jgi:hypothetical protein
MGDNFLKQQVRNFKKGQDRATNELSRRRLVDHPELVRTAYPVSEINGYSLNVGDVLLVIPSPIAGQVDLALGTRHVGTSEGDAATALRSALVEPNGPGGILVEVISKGGLSGVAQVRIKGGTES